MGSLKPGASYIYEHVDGITYAREHGAPINTRFEIGRTFDRVKHDEELKRQELWKDIYKVAEQNSTLKNAIDECIMLYYLSKQHGSKT